MKRKYKGYAQSIGFDPIQAPDTTRRMAEADNRMIRGMEAQRDAIRQNREAVSQGLSRKNQLEAENRDQNYRFNKQNRQMVQDAELRNRQTLIENANRQAAAQVNQLKPLAEFSESLSKAVTSYEEAASEQAYMEGINEVMLNGLPEETLAQQQMLEGALTSQDEQIQRVADGLSARGAGPEIVFGVRSVGKSRELGRMKARIMLASSSYGDWLEDQFLTDEQTSVEINGRTITPATAATPEDKAAMRELLREKFLKQTGLFGAKPALLYEGLVKMREAEMSMAARDRQTYAKTESDRLFQDAESSFEAQISTDPGTAVNNWLRQVSRTLNTDGRTPLGPRAALDMLKQKLRNAPHGTVTEETIAAIEATAPFNQPTTTYGKQFPWFFQELREDIRKDRREQFLLEEAEQGIEQKEKLDQFREFISKNNVPREQVQAFIDEWRKQYGTVPAELAQYMDAYGVLPGLNVTTEALERQFEAAAQDGTLTLADVTDPRVPIQIREKYRPIAERVQKETEAAPESKMAKEAFENALEAKMTGFKDAMGNIPSVTLDFAVADAFRKYQQKYRTLLAGSTDPQQAAKAQQQAMNDVLNQIMSNTKGSPYYFPEDYDPTTDKPEFQFFLGQLTGAPVSSAQSQAGAQKFVGSVMRTIDSVGKESVLDSHLLIPKPILEEAARNFNTPNFRIPALAQAIAEKFGGRVSPYEVLNRQLKARGLPEIVPPTAVQAASQLDPRLQRILNFSNSYNRSRRATVSAQDYTPFLNLIASKESTSYGGYDAMNRGGRAGGTVAIGSANSKQVFGRGLSEMTIGEVMQLQASGQLHAAGRYQIIQSTLAGLMSGAYGPVPFKPTDRFDQVNQDQMAISLARFRLKRGGANPVNLREEFRNEWVGFRKVDDATLDNAIQGLRAAATSPYRSPDFMSPRLVYHIASRGYGSTGPHLDVKPVARGSTKGDPSQRISKAELDKYVSVKKGDKLIPISMGTITTDDDSRHRARGSYGHDFAAPEGTGVYLKNGARVVENWVDNSKRGQGSHRMVIELPDGRRYAFIHGTAAKGATNT